MTTDLKNKLILNEEETKQLFTDFFHEALAFMNIPTEKYPDIYISYECPLPIHIDFENSKILITISHFRDLIISSPTLKNDGPTIYRTFGYMFAYKWYVYLTTGEKLNRNRDLSAIIFAESLKIIKGVPTHNYDKTPSIAKKILGFDPNDKRPILKMLKDVFGMDCEMKSNYDIASRKIINHISFTSDEHKKRSTELETLYNESINRPMPTIGKDELGSESNPFSNIDEAADFILKLEKERLQTDRYRQKISNELFYYDYARNYFRIGWASPNVAYYPLKNAKSPCFVANQLSQINKKKMPRFSLKPSLRNNKFLYRGQAEFYENCRPSIFRDDKKDYFVDDIIQINEMEVLLNKHPLVKLFEQGFFLMHEFIQFKIDYSGLSQHYYNKTNLLDLTSEMEVAKFFAVTTFNMSKDCYEKYTGDKLGVLYYYDIQADTFTERKGRTYHVRAIGKQPFMRSGNQSGFLINLGKEDNFNLFPEVRYVFFRHDPDITSRIFKESHNGDKYMPQELLRSHWYKRMSNKEEKKRISCEALKLNFMNNPNESHTHIRRELQKKGFKISSKYKSAFTDEELDLYYKNSISIWEEFCSNIYFYSPEGNLLKKHLLNLPNDKRYRWAFYKEA